MEIFIRKNSDLPIYEQVTTQIKALISKGKLSPGEAIPSMRALAKKLGISVITVQRAYDELAKEGFIETIPAKGSFISENCMAFFEEEMTKKLEMHLQSAVQIAHDFDIPVTTLHELIDFFNEEGD